MEHIYMVASHVAANIGWFSFVSWLPKLSNNSE
jgi:hypothetical protein